MKKIKLFADGPTLDEIKNLQNIDGYTFNPSLFKKLKAKNYIKFTEEILKFTGDKSVSIEVFGDDEKTCYDQAKKIASLSKNISVKIPITYTNGKFSTNLISKLIKENIKLNITAIFTQEQIKEIINVVKNTNTILSVFAGRLFDIGIDANQKLKEITEYTHSNSKCRILWASCRQPYDYINAINSNSDIITMGSSMIKKLKNLNSISPEDYSKETVKNFYEDAKSSGFKI